MEVTLTITCSCGNQATIPLKRETEESQGKVFTDCLEIGTSLEEHDSFSSFMTSPEDTRLTCNQCGEDQDLSL